MRKLLFLFIIPICFLGCKKTDQAKVDQQLIEAYIDSNHLNAIAEPNGLYYVPISTGGGGYPLATSTVNVTYKGYLLNKTVFDQENAVVSVDLTTAIAGWTEGLPLMRKGGRCTLIVPSSLGYGAQAETNIPANSVLLFDIYLVSYQ